MRKSAPTPVLCLCVLCPKRITGEAHERNTIQVMKHETIASPRGQSNLDVHHYLPICWLLLRLDHSKHILKHSQDLCAAIAVAQGNFNNS